MKPRLVEVTLTIRSDARLKELGSAKWWDLVAFGPGFDWSLLNSLCESEEPIVLRASAKLITEHLAAAQPKET